MVRIFRLRSIAILIFVTLAAPLAPGGGRPLAQEPEEEEGPASPEPFVVYTQYNPTFVPGESRLHFSVTAFARNSSRAHYANVTFKRGFPEGFKVEPVGGEVQAVVQRPPEFWEKVEGNTYSMFMPKLSRGRGTSIFYKLRFSGRPDEVRLPGLDISYEIEGQPPTTARTPEDLVNLKPYSFFSGSLKDFLKRNAEVSMDVGLKGDPWRLAAIDARAALQNPTGITGVSGDLGKGHFRLQAGLPGNYRDMLVIWWPTSKAKQVQDEAKFRGHLKEYMTWVGVRALVDESVKVTRDRKFRNFTGWYAEGTWKDIIADRFGEGPFGATLFYSPARDAEFLLFWWAQGRGIGPALANTPQPDKESQLFRELLAIAESFRAFQKA